MSKSRIALVGAGWWSQGWHLPHLHNNGKCVLAAIIDGNAHPKSPLNAEMESLNALSERYSAPTFSSLEEMMAPDSGAGPIDGVVVATNHASHHALATQAMRDYGMHVFCEKPMTVDIDEAKDLVAVSRRAGKTFMVNNTANWRPQTVEAMGVVESGALGTLRHATVVFHAPTQAVFDDPINVGWNEPSGRMVGNGFAWGQLAHPLAWLWMVSGLTPEKVFSFNGKGTNTAADMYDACAIRCVGGATVSVSGVAKLPGNDKHIEQRLIGDDGALTYIGLDEDKGQSDGSVEGAAPRGWQGLQVARFDKTGARADEGFDFEETEQDGDGAASLNAFLDACNGAPHFKGADAVVGLKAVATIDAIYRSAQSGQAESTLLEGLDLE